MKKAVLAGYYGFGNIGDEALLEVLISKIKEINPKTKIIILANNPKDIFKRLKTPAVDRANILHIIKALFGSDKIIFGGGGLFQDITSFKSLLYYLGLIVIAKIMRNKVYLIAQGIGPIKRNVSHKLLSIIFRMVDEFSVRDKKSFELLSNLYKKKITITSDPALLLKYRRDVRFDENSKKVIISLRKSPHFTKSKKDIFIQVLKKLMIEENIEPVFLPFHGQDDKKVSLEIINMLDGPLKLEEPQTNPLYLLRVMDGTSIVIGMRLHSLIFAAGLGIPFIGISYDPKVTSFCNSYKSPVFEIESLNPFDLEKSIKDVLSLRNTYSKRIKEICDKQKDNINNYLNEALK